MIGIIILGYLIQDFMNLNELDQCVSCWEDTEYTKGTNIHYRNFYIEGAGQLCESCYIEIYGKA